MISKFKCTGRPFEAGIRDTDSLNDPRRLRDAARSRSENRTLFMKLLRDHCENSVL